MASAPMHHRNVGFRLHKRISRLNCNESRTCRLAKIPNGFFHKPLKSRKFKREWKRHALIVLITALGVVNDDMFLLCFAMPLLILNILRYLVGKWYDKISFSVVTGIAIGGALLKVLVECDVVWYLTSPLKLVRAQDLGSWFNDMFLSYLFMFRVSSVMGRELKSLEIIKFAAVFSTMLFSAGAVLVAGYRAIASRFSKSDERSAYIVLMFLAITMSAFFVNFS